MSIARIIYEAKDEFRSVFTDYTPIINHFGNAVVRVDDKDYSGDSRVLYDQMGSFNTGGKNVGVFIFGWGSCSGCDALQACWSYEEVDKLISELEPTVKWFTSYEEATTYFKTHDWAGDYSWHTDETKRFVNACIGYLTSISESA